MRSFIKKFVSVHKFVSTMIAVFLIGGGYYWYSSTTAATAAATYVVSTASTGTVVASVSGTGQAENVSQIDIKPQVTETVTDVYVQPGDRVTMGQLLVQLDSTNEERSLKQAQLSLQSAELALQKLQEVTTSTLISNENAVVQAEQAAENASTTLATDYGNGYDTLGTVFVGLQTIMTDAGNFATGYNINRSQQDPLALVNVMPSYLQPATQPYANAVAPAYNAALAAYQATLADYNQASRNSPPATLDGLFAESYHTAQLVAATDQAINNLLNFVVNNYPADAQHAPLPSIVTTFQTTYGNDLKNADSEMTAAQGVGTTISSDIDSLTNAENSLAEASTTLAELVAGPTQVDIQSQQVSIDTAKLNLQTAEQNLAYTSIRAPVDGTISAVSATVGETVPDPAVSMVSGKKIAQVTLNEVDAAKVKLGDKATLTFDAVNGLSVAGQVIEVDPVGTVSQGVVSYNVQVSMIDSSSTAQVKPGMSTTANIVTAVAENAVTVPASAVITQSGQSYVLEPSMPVSPAAIAAAGSQGLALSAPPKRVPVTVGLTNATVAEITFGISAGDEIIVQTVSGSAATITTGGSGGGPGRGGRFLFGG